MIATVCDLPLMAETPGDSGPVLLPDWRREVEFPALLAARGLVRGAEIGVERGAFAEVLCQSNPAVELLCVDAWESYRGYREHVSQEKLDGFYHETVLRLRPYPVTIRRGRSVDVAQTIPDRSLDFVYIDANHTFPHVIADLAAWTPKVRVGGIVAGHDYGRRSVGQVREAVQAWTSVYRIRPWYVLMGDRSPSWLWVV